MNIPLISGQLAKLHVKLETEEDFELYGGTTKAGFSITPERPEAKNEWLVTIDEQKVAGKPLTRFDIYVRQISTGREWVVLSGKLLVSPRTAGVDADKLAPIEYNVTIPVVENAVDLTGAAIVTGITGPRGWSAYEIAVQNGFVGSEPEWLEYMRQQTATLAVEQVTPLMERAETAAGEAGQAAAAAEAHNDAAHEAQDGAENEADRATEAADKAAQHEDTVRGLITEAAAHVKAAAQSAQDALANQQSAKQAAQDAKTAKNGAEQAAVNADASKSAAQTAEGNAKASAAQAAADKTAAEQAKLDAQAAQSTAEEQAAIAKAAAEAAQAPESIAAQAARPATMVLVYNELVRMLGDESMLHVDTDGQKIIVHTDRLNDEQLKAVTDMLERFVPQFIEVEQYNHNIEISWRDINKYAECVNYADMVAVNPDFANDLTSDGEWCYNLPKLKCLNLQHEDAGKWGLGFWKANKLIKKWSVELPAVTEAGSGFADSSIEIFDGGFPALVCPTYQYYADKIEAQGQRIFQNATKLWFFRGDLSKARRLNMAFQGCTSLTEFHSTLESLCTADNAFAKCKLDKESALRILNSLPGKEYVDSVYTNLSVVRQQMTLGIHIDHQNDEDVLVAIASAEGKSWKLTVQWNPGGPTYTTPEASTFSLGTLIYAKVGEMERPDGTTEQYLDWGHYVTNWEERGYEQFRSLESAYRYFGLPEESI